MGRNRGQRFDARETPIRRRQQLRQRRAIYADLSGQRNLGAVGIANERAETLAEGFK